MTTFITGGASQTGLALARLLHQAGHPVLFGSRVGRNIPSSTAWTPFDWDKPSTFPNAFTFPDLPEIASVYLVVNPGANPLPEVAPFIDLAIEKGVKRFVLLGAADVPKGIEMGRVHEYLEEKGVDFVTLRPTWFIDNLARTQLENICDRNEIATPVPTGRVAFVAVEDIAQVAFDAITYPGPTPKDEGHTAPIILGPNLLTYNELAEILTEVLGRPINHRTITVDELLAQYESFGVQPDSDSAKYLVGLELGLEKGDAEALWHLEEGRKRIGKLMAREWIERNKAIWSK
ncbi:hypothetical protein D9611_000313 [Ephemerocybe angulata]|uniref:NmrA-like domain-containing protein n=1 Tax=Ephemerocybe angulata TaxID=980116 RepID=A0A8H5BM32_9AGAR|nr:hypothetical protein D9611_000313 [Tulosesus angulatus]